MSTQITIKSATIGFGKTHAISALSLKSCYNYINYILSSKTGVASIARMTIISAFRLITDGMTIDFGVLQSDHGLKMRFAKSPDGDIYLETKAFIESINLILDGMLECAKPEYKDEFKSYCDIIKAEFDSVLYNTKQISMSGLN